MCSRSLCVVRFLPRDAMQAKYMTQSCVCLSAISRCSTETAKRRITQITPHDSPGTLVFKCRRSRQSSTGVTPNGGAAYRWGRLKLATFEKQFAITRKRRPSQASSTQFGRKFITLSIHLCLQQVYRDAARRSGSSATAEFDTCQT